MHLKRGHISEDDLSLAKAMKDRTCETTSRSRAEYRWREAYRYLNKLDREVEVPNPCRLQCSAR